MGLFKGLKKLAKKAVKLAVKTAPVWSSFVPGGSVVGSLVGGGSGGLLGKFGGLAKSPSENFLRHGVEYIETGEKPAHASRSMPVAMKRMRSRMMRQERKQGAGIRGVFARGNVLKTNRQRERISRQERRYAMRFRRGRRMKRRAA